MIGLTAITSCLIFLLYPMLNRSKYTDNQRRLIQLRNFKKALWKKSGYKESSGFNIGIDRRGKIYIMGSGNFNSRFSSKRWFLWKSNRLFKTLKFQIRLWAIRRKAGPRWKLNADLKGSLITMLSIILISIMIILTGTFLPMIVFGMSADFPKFRSGSSYIIAASDSIDKTRADKVCSGSNDEVEINWAIDECDTAGGGTIELMQGNYSARQIYLRDNVRLKGQGWGTIIKLPDGVTEAQSAENGNHGATVIGVLIADGHIDFASVEDLTIDGNRSNQNALVGWAGRYGFEGVLIDNADHIQMKNLQVHSCWAAGIYVEPVGGTARYNVVKDCHVHGNGEGAIVNYGGIYTEEALYTVIDNCYSYDNVNHNIRCHGNDIVMGCFANNSTGGKDIYIDGDNCTVSDCIVEENLYLIGAKECDIVGGNQIDTLELIRLSGGDGANYNTIEGNTMKYLKLTYEADYNTIIGNTISNGLGHGILMQSASNNTISNNTIVGCGQSADNSFDGIHITGGTAASDSNYIHHNEIRHLGGANQFRYGIYLDAVSDIPTNNIVEDNDLRNSGKTGPWRDDGIATEFKRRRIDMFMDVLAVSANVIRSNEDLSAGIPIAFTIDAQPDIPRTLSGHFDSHAQITAYTIDIVGVDAKGNTLTESKTEADGWDWETSNAFATITSITMSARTGTGAGDTMDIGVTDVIGLSDAIYTTADVFKIKKNNANVTVAIAQVNATYHTYDMAVITLAVTDDFTIWYSINKNKLS